MVNKKSSLELTITDSENFNKILSFNPHWLRFSCRLSILKETGQRLIEGHKIPLDLTIKNVKIADNNKNLIIEWNEESEQADSLLPIAFLVNHYPETSANENRFKPCLVREFF